MWERWPAWKLVIKLVQTKYEAGADYQYFQDLYEAGVSRSQLQLNMLNCPADSTLQVGTGCRPRLIIVLAVSLWPHRLSLLQPVDQPPDYRPGHPPVEHVLCTSNLQYLSNLSRSEFWSLISAFKSYETMFSTLPCKLYDTPHLPLIHWNKENTNFQYSIFILMEII